MRKEKIPLHNLCFQINNSSDRIGWWSPARNGNDGQLRNRIEVLLGRDDGPPAIGDDPKWFVCEYEEYTS